MHNMDQSTRQYGTRQPLGGTTVHDAIGICASVPLYCKGSLLLLEQPLCGHAGKLTNVTDINASRSYGAYHNRLALGCSLKLVLRLHLVGSTWCKNKGSVEIATM